MKRQTRFCVLALAVLLAVAIPSSSCMTGATAGTPQRSALETAKLTYADASLAYEASMITIRDLRARSLISDGQWSRVDQAQQQVRKWAPVMRSALDLWEASGSKPDAFDRASSALSGAFADVKAVSAEVK